MLASHYLVWRLRGGLGEHVLSEGRSDAVAVGVHGVVPVHVHVHVDGVQGDVTRVHGAVARVQLCTEGTCQPQLPPARSLLQTSATLLLVPPDCGSVWHTLLQRTRQRTPTPSIVLTI